MEHKAVIPACYPLKACGYKF